MRAAARPRRLRPAVAHRARGVAAAGLAPHRRRRPPRHRGRLWIGGRLGHVITTAAGPVAPVRPRARDRVGAGGRVGGRRRRRAARGVSRSSPWSRPSAADVASTRAARPRRCGAGRGRSRRGGRVRGAGAARSTAGTTRRSTARASPLWAADVLAGGRCDRCEGARHRGVEPDRSAHGRAAGRPRRRGHHAPAQPGGHGGPRGARRDHRPRGRRHARATGRTRWCTSRRRSG